MVWNRFVLVYWIVKQFCRVWMFWEFGKLRGGIGEAMGMVRGGFGRTTKKKCLK